MLYNGGLYRASALHDLLRVGGHLVLLKDVGIAFVRELLSLACVRASAQFTCPFDALIKVNLDSLCRLLVELLRLVVDLSF